MVTITPDIIANIKLYSKDKGGRSKGIPSVQFGCPIIINGEYFDCRLLLDQAGISLELDSNATVPIKFLSPHIVKPILKQGSKFELWEMGIIGEGTVLKIFK